MEAADWQKSMCVDACVYACVRVCVCACVLASFCVLEQLVGVSSAVTMTGRKS